MPESTRQPDDLDQLTGTLEFRPDITRPGTGAGTTVVRVPGYCILRVLGRGGMGVVYQAVQEKANREVALKMILAGAHADAADLVRFRAEAEAAARLSHPNIVQLYEVGETPEGFPYFSLEYVAGGTLAEYLKSGPLKPGAAAALLETLARAMHYAHEHHIVHRDLKPGNILLSAAQRDALTAVLLPKISDFGLAKQLDGDDGMTRTGAILGTPSYMAPEQAFGLARTVGPAADIYALGAILYECLTGRPPFKGTTVADTLEQVRTLEPATLRTSSKEIPRDLETICLHCLHKDPQRRYATAEALAEDLRRYQHGQPITVRPVGRVERAWRWCRRNPGWAATIGAVILSVAATMVLLAVFLGIVSDRNSKLAQEVADRTRAEQLAAEHADLVMDALGKIVHDFQSDLQDIPGSKVIREKLLKEALQQLAKLKDSPATSSRVLRRHMLAHLRMAELANSLSDRTRAREENRLALEYARKAVQDNPTSDKNRANLYSAILVQAYDDRYLKETKDAALANFHVARRGLEELQVQLAAHPDGDPALDREERVTLLQVELDLALACEYIGSWYADTNQTERAFWVRQALAARERIVARTPTPDTRMKLASTYGTMAGVTGAQNDLNQSLEYFLKQLRELKTALAEAPYRFRLRKEVAMSHFSVHRAFWDLGRYGEASAIYRDGIPMLEQLVAADPAEPAYATFLAEMNYAAGYAFLRNGNPQQARLHFARALDLREKTFNAAQAKKAPSIEVPRAYYMLSLARCGDHVRAAEHAEEYRRLGKPGRDNIIDVYGATYALCYGAITQDRAADQLTADEVKLREHYLAQAIAAFQQGASLGFTKIRFFDSDPDLDAIRGTAAFQAWLADFRRQLAAMQK